MLRRHIDQYVDRHLGRRLRERRQALQLELGSMARELGVEADELQAYEDGDRRVPARLLRKLAGLLAVEIDYFFRDGVAQPEPVATEAYNEAIAFFLLLPEARPLVEAFTAILDEDERLAVVKVAQMLRDGRNERLQ